MNITSGDLLGTTCAICLTDAYDREIYAANFRFEDLNPDVFSARRLPDRLHYRMVVCRHCGLMRANPVLSLPVLSTLYAQSHGLQPYLSQAAADAYVHYFKENFSSLPFQARILEIGCGNGMFLKALMQQNYEQVYGVEPSHEAVEQSGQIKGLIYNGMFGSGIYPKDYFDVICAFQMFDHLSDPRQFLIDCRENLKSQGKIFLILHNNKALPATILGPSSPIVDIEHPILYNPDTIVKLLEDNGFTVQKKFSVLNRYPLKYWLQLFPLPLWVKKPLLDFFQKSSIGNVPVTLGAGNMGIIARKKMFDLQGLSTIQKQLRRRLLEAIFRQKQSHLGSCLSAIDAMICIYGIKRPQDRFVLSNGHAGFALYVVLENEGLMDMASFEGLNTHPDRCVSKGIYVSSGSLGQGLPIALGMAMADPQKDIYCMISDGECAEGSIWESLRISVEQKVKNLKIIVNVNGWAAYMPVDPQRLKAQFEGFGVKVIEVNGHSLPDLDRAFSECHGGESIVFAVTNVEQFPFLKGLDAHYYVMNALDYNQAMEALR